MSETAQFWLASLAVAVITSLCGLLYRANIASNARVEKQVGEIGKNVDKLTTTVFGVNNDNGLYGESRETRTLLARFEAAMQSLCILCGFVRDVSGTVSFGPGESPLERRISERRHSVGRRASDTTAG